ncbi:MAG: hypothetical protein ACREEC_00845 [Thermoplasmata archaeon]
MTDTIVEETTPTPRPRTFWPSDYRKFAQVVRQVRRADPAKGDELAAGIAAVFAADSERFDFGLFTGSTVELPAHVGALASVIKQTRHVRCQPHTLKAVEHQDAVDAMASVVSSLLYDTPGFDQDRFAAGTQLLSQASLPDYDRIEADEADEADVDDDADDDADPDGDAGPF